MWYSKNWQFRSVCFFFIKGVDFKAWALASSDSEFLLRRSAQEVFSYVSWSVLVSVKKAQFSLVDFQSCWWKSFFLRFPSRKFSEPHFVWEFSRSMFLDYDQVKACEGNVTKESHTYIDEIFMARWGLRVFEVVLAGFCQGINLNLFCFVGFCFLGVVTKTFIKRVTLSPQKVGETFIFELWFGKVQSQSRQFNLW
jgi:hypothetical protein